LNALRRICHGVTIKVVEHGFEMHSVPFDLKAHTSGNDTAKPPIQEKGALTAAWRLIALSQHR
jgi:hypothetical protein